MKTFITACIAFFLLPAFVVLAPAQQSAKSSPVDGKSESKDAPKAPSKFDPDPPLAVTQHQITIGGKPLRYKASAGFLPLRDESGKIKATMFVTAYTKEDVSDVAKRPVTFVFNGGPGSASLWLHIGLMGPKRVLMGNDGESLAPPYSIVANEYTWLDETDLVFIDPVMTGFSRPAAGEEAKQFLGYEEDLAAVGECIRSYTSRNNRWSSPKFLAGESYGTTRAAGLSGYLQTRYNFFLNGVVLISTILNFQTARFAPGNNDPYILFLPTYAATAWCHKRLAPELQQKDLKSLLDEVERFASTDYALALWQGTKLPDAARKQVVERIARYTGLSPQYVEQSNLRISQGRFCKELLRTERRTVGRLDSRFKGIDIDAAGENIEFDPSLNATISGPFTTMINHYLRGELAVGNDNARWELPFESLTGRVQPWNYSNVQNQYLNVAETLRSAMSKNPFMKVWVASGYYDFATPYFAADYTLRQMQLDPVLQGNISQTYYEAGHMMYIHKPSLVQLKTDFVKFLRAAIK
jgi:carboxypeptidase C (cathepsin A)